MKNDIRFLINILIRLSCHFNYKRKIQLIFLFLMMIANAIAEICNLSLIIPFITVLTNKDKLNDFKIINYFSELFSIQNPNDILISITLIFCLTTLTAMSIRLINIYLYGKVSALLGADISVKAYRNLLTRPYIYYIQKNKSEFIIALQEYSAWTVGVISSALQIFLALIIIFSILLSLFIVNATVIFIISFSCLILYSILSRLLNKKFENLSTILTNRSKEQLQVLQEGFGSIIDINLYGDYKYFLSIYSKIVLELREKQQQMRFLSTFPRYIIEAFVLIIFALIGLFMAIRFNNIASLIPLIAFISLAIQKLLPSFQMIYSNISLIKSQKKSVLKILDILDYKFSEDSFFDEKNYIFFKKIEFKNVGFQYTINQPKIINDFSLTFYESEKIGIVGSSGAGKSTFINLLMGLLEPSEGSIFVDDKCISNAKIPNKLLSWKSSISYVPQTLFLSDASIAENIAVGESLSEIDYDRLEEACHNAKILSFIKSNKEGFLSKVGDNGIKLSGGQRQRIGIARALYRKSKILVLDEATSALDVKTEEQFLNCIFSLKDKLTIFIVTHRLSTVKSCDKIMIISEGRLKYFGKPEEKTNIN